MWTAVDNFVGSLEPGETFLIYDGPLSFLTEHGGKQFYVHFADGGDGHMDYFVREVDEVRLTALRENRIPVRDFLMSANPLHVARVHNHSGHVEVFRVDPLDFAPDFFPAPGVTLYGSDVLSPRNIRPEVRILLALLREFDAVGLVREKYARFGNDAPPKLLDSAIAKLAEVSGE